MDTILTAILDQLNLLSVSGDDVERLCAVKHMVRQLQAAFIKAKTISPSLRKERSLNAEHSDNP